MWVFKHIELVDDVELDFAEFRQIVRRLLATALILTLLCFGKLLIDLVLDGTVPAADLTVIESGQEATLRIERCHLD